MKHLLIILSFLLLSSPVIGQSSKNVDPSLLAKELMLWMQANCNVPGIPQEHNFCNMNWDYPFPEVTVFSKKQLIREFRNHSGYIPGGEYDELRGFYLRNTDQIYMLDQDYSQIEYQTDIIHELVHYIQQMNGFLTNCPPHYEIPAYLMQIHYFREKTGRGATADMIEEYKRHFCNTLY